MKHVPLALATLVAAVLVACGTGGGTPGPDNGPDVTESPTQPATDQGTAPPTGDAGADGTEGGSQLAAVSLSFDGQPVPIATACTGADGAVLVTTEGEVTVILVREDGTALRYNGEGMTAETSDVTIEEIGQSTVYEATLESDQVEPVDVTLEVADTSELEECPA